MAGLLAVATAGLLLGISVLSDDDAGTDSPPNNVGAGVSAPARRAPASSRPRRSPRRCSSRTTRSASSTPTATAPSSTASAALVDGDRDTAWESDSYFNPPFGGKPGMGILIELAEPREVTSVRVYSTAPAPRAKLLTGSGDNDGSKAGDQKLVSEYKNQIGAPLDKHEATTLTFGGFLPDEKYQYLLVWFTELPRRPTASCA